MKTAVAFERAGLPVRAKAIDSGGAHWLMTNSGMVRQWGSCNGMDGEELNTLIEEDVAFDFPDSVKWVGRKHQQWGSLCTMAPRPVASWKRSVESARAAGFNPWMFAEPGVDADPHSRLVVRPGTLSRALFNELGFEGRFGCHQNFVQSLSDLLYAEPDAEMIFTFQDDCFVPHGAKEFLDSIDFDEISLLSLWCPSGHGYPRPFAEVRQTPQPNIVGSVCWAMPRATAEWIVDNDYIRGWRHAPEISGADIKGDDMAVGIALLNNGSPAVYLSPSLVDHFEPVYGNSAIDHGPVAGFRKSYKYGGDLSAESLLESYCGLPIHVVIPACNCIDLTVSCLKALKASTVPVRVCYVDNGSHARNFATLAGFLSSEFRDSVIIRNPENYGFTKAVQQGIDCRQDSHVLLLNNDCRVTPNTLSSLYSRLCEHSHVAAVNPLSTDSGRCSFQSALNAEVSRTRGVRSTDVVPFFCTLIRREALAAVSELPADREVESGFFVDDWWSMKIREKGYGLLIDGQTVVDHDCNATFKDLGIDVRHEMEKGRGWLQEGG